MTDDSDIRDLVGAYVLDAVDPDERERLEAELAQSIQTRTEVTELTQTATLLGLAVDPVQPSSGLKASLMARIAVTPQLSRDSSLGTSTTTSAATVRAERHWFQRPGAAMLAAAAAIGLIFAGGVLANTVADQRYLATQSDELAAINAADDLERAVVPVEGGGTATLVWSVELTSSALIVDGLEPLPSDRVYELWYMGDEGTRPAGTFTVSDEDRVWRVLEGDMGAGDVVGVTVEPRGGSDLPTTAPIITIES